MAGSIRGQFGWIWKLHIPEKIKIFLWLILHNAIPNNSLLVHHSLSQDAIVQDASIMMKLFWIILEVALFLFKSGIWWYV